MNKVVNERRGSIFAEEDLPKSPDKGDASGRSNAKKLTTNSLFGSRSPTKRWETYPL